MNNIRLSKKEHQCMLCFEIIPPKTLYSNYVVTPWNSSNDDFFTHKSHISCNNIWQRYMDKYYWTENYYPYYKQEWDDICSEFAFVIGLE